MLLIFDNNAVVYFWCSLMPSHVCAWHHFRGVPYHLISTGYFTRLNKWDGDRLKKHHRSKQNTYYTTYYRNNLQLLPKHLNAQGHSLNILFSMSMMLNKFKCIRGWFEFLHFSTQTLPAIAKNYKNYKNWPEITGHI